MTRANGYTLIEMLIAVALAAILFVGLGGVVSQALQTHDYVSAKNDLTRQARFAMEQMVRAASRSPRLLLPLNDNPNTNWFEHVREEPATPVAPSIKSTAVLAITLDPAQDLDGNGIPDADNDGDGRIDEDLPNDANYDNAAGILGIDDNGDGVVDDSAIGSWDDDEDDSANEDSVFNNNDADGDGSIDEDPYADMNFDSAPGIAGVDDDEDGNIDEGGALNSWNDDEDNLSDEDWYDVVVFYLDNGTLLQRIPVPWDESGGGIVSGLDFIEQPIAENVAYFRVERLPQKGNRPVMVDLTLELTSPNSSEAVSLHHRVRVGGAL